MRHDIHDARLNAILSAEANCPGVSPHLVSNGHAKGIAGEIRLRVHPANVSLAVEVADGLVTVKRETDEIRIVVDAERRAPRAAVTLADRDCRAKMRPQLNLSIGAQHEVGGFEVLFSYKSTMSHHLLFCAAQKYNTKRQANRLGQPLQSKLLAASSATIKPPALNFARCISIDGLLYMENNHRLLSAINPKSVVVLGASDREGSRGSFVWRGVMNSRRVLEAYPVNPKYKYIGLTPCWAKLSDLPSPPDLAVIATSSRRVEEILADCTKAGIKNVLITPGEGEFTEDRLWRERIANAARASRMRLVGVDSLGLIRPKSGLNVSYWPRLPLAGHIGLVCQTASTATAVLDLAENSRFGFSSVVSVGAETDVSIDEVIDCLAQDDETQVIAADVLAVKHPRAFFSAIRAASRRKPVLILHGGRAAGIESLTATRLNSPSADSDAFAAAVRKAGGTPTTSLADFCGALKLLATGHIPAGSHTAVLGNGIGAAAAGAAVLAPAHLEAARLSSATHNALSELLRSPAATVDPTDAGPEAVEAVLAQAAEQMLADGAADALIAVMAPAAASTVAVAPLLAACAEKQGKPVVAVRLGAPSAAFAAAAAEAGLPTAPTPEAAARMLSLAREAVQAVQKTPLLSSPGSASGTWDTDAARTVVEDAQRHSRFVLSETDLSQILRCYGIATAAGMLATTADEAIAAASRIGYPVVLKVSAAGIAHKTDARGVLLNLKEAGAVKAGFEELQNSIAKLAPQAKFRGVWMQSMIAKPAGRELKLTLDTDPVLGPVIHLGVGGMAASLFSRRATLIPPVTEAEAREALASFEARAWLAAFRGMPAANVTSLVNVILRLSAIAETLPAVTRLSLSPLVLDDEGALVLDVDGTVNAAASLADDKTQHLAFASFPRRLHQPVRLDNGFVMIRSIRSDDALRLQAFAGAVSPDVCRSFFGKDAASLTARDLADLSNPDFDREAVIIAIDDSSVDPAIHAVVRLRKLSARTSSLSSAYESRWLDETLQQALAASLKSVADCLEIPLPAPAAAD